MSAITKLPTTFRRIELELAREPDHPVGDPTERYTLIAPLDAEGRIDSDLWGEHREACRVVRTHEGEVSAGHIVHGPGGIWRFEFDISGSAPVERAFRLSDERLQPGEYVSIIREDGEHPYCVMSVSGV